MLPPGVLLNATKGYSGFSVTSILMDAVLNLDKVGAVSVSQFFSVTYQISKRCFHHRKMLSLSRFTSREILPITVVNPKANII